MFIKKVISYKHKRRPTDRVTTLIDTTNLYPLCSVRGVLQSTDVWRPDCFSSNSINFFSTEKAGNDSNLLIVFYVQIMPDDFVMQLHRF